LLKNAVSSISLALLLVACAAQPRPAVEAGQTRALSDEPFAWPAQARLFQVDTEATDLRVVVYPDGPLARLGHSHVIGGPVVSGRIALAEPWQDSALALTVDVDGLEVDRPEWRRDEGFERDPSESAIQGTRENMRSSAVLDVADHPLVEIQSLGLRGPRWQPDIDLRIRLRGVARELTVPVSLTLDGDRMVAIGRFSLAQSDFGMAPFSVAGGQLAVADRVDLRFRIVARATDEGPRTSFSGSRSK
jgi:polyisoprenoid-binding protein YceI